MERFLAAPEAYQANVLPPDVRVRVVIEAASSAYWYRFVGLDGVVIGIDQFGLSAPAEDVYQYFGVTVEKTIAALERLFGE